MKEELIRLQQLKTAYVTPLALSTISIIPNKLHESLKLLYISHPIQQAVILNACEMIRKFLAEEQIGSAWSARPLLF